MERLYSQSRTSSVDQELNIDDEEFLFFYSWKLGNTNIQKLFLIHNIIVDIIS